MEQSDGDIPRHSSAAQREIELLRRIEDLSIELAESERNYRALFESIDEGLCIIEVLFDDHGKAADYRFLQVNPAFERQTGLKSAVGERMRALAPEHEEHWFETYGRIATTGQSERFENRADALGHWYEVFAFRIGEAKERRVGILFNDIKERKRAEVVLRESEERFQQFAKASSGALWIRNATTLTMEYVSPSISTIYGVEPDFFLGDMKRWAALIVPEDRDIALRHIEQARQGEAVVHEFRIQRPSDYAFRWIRNTDFPLFDEQGRVQRIGGIAEDVTDAKLAGQHQSVLLAELQHRVRNIMAVIRSIAARTGENASSVQDYAEMMAGRFLTLARVQALLTRAANVGVNIITLVHEELVAQAHHADQYTTNGPAVVLSPKAAEVLTLALHELATNALKYGALSSGAGHVTVTWEVIEKRDIPWLHLDWNEQGAPPGAEALSPAMRPRGFGRELIEGRIPYELGGRAHLEITAAGAQCRLEFPLRKGANILETDAPKAATVFGGALDMSGEADLSGQRILVVEDDYFLASDTSRAIRGTGAEVLGPCPTEDAALDWIEDGAPTGAVVDINLGFGPSFKIAEMLRQNGVPFVFITGYDEEIIPPDFAEVRRLQKPVDLKQIVNALADILA